MRQIVRRLMERSDKNSGRKKILIGLVLVCAGMPIIVFVGLMGLASGFSLNSGGGASDGFWEIVGLGGLLLLAAGAGFILNGAADAVRSSDVLVAGIVWLLASVPGWAISIGQLRADMQNCAFRRTESFCAGDALPPVPQGTTSRIRLRDAAYAWRYPDDTPAWVRRMSDELRAFEVIILRSGEWDLAFFELSTDPEVWQLFAQQRSRETAPTPVSLFGRLGSTSWLGPNELLIEEGTFPSYSYSRIDVATLSARLVTAGPDSDGIQGEVYALDGGDHIIVRSHHTPLRLSARSNRLAPVSGASDERPGFFDGRQRLVDHVDANGEYQNTGWVTTPGTTNAPVVHGDGFLCVGAPSGVCLVHEREEAREPWLATRLRVGLGTGGALSILLLTLHLVLSWFFWARNVRGLQDTSERRSTFRLGVAATAAAITSVLAIGYLS